MSRNDFFAISNKLITWMLGPFKLLFKFVRRMDRATVFCCFNLSVTIFVYFCVFLNTYYISVYLSVMVNDNNLQLLFMLNTSILGLMSYTCTIPKSRSRSWEFKKVSMDMCLSFLCTSLNTVCQIPCELLISNALGSILCRLCARNCWLAVLLKPREIAKIYSVVERKFHF